MNNSISTVYKRELKLYFCTVVGWLFIAINIAALMICAVWLGFKNANPSYQYVPETATLLLCFTAPLLSLISAAEAKRGETAMLLRYVSPISVTVGKYLAQLTVFAIPLTVAEIIPLVMMPFGISSLLLSYLGVICYALVGAALLALSLFIATLIKEPIISAVVSVVASLLLNVSSNLVKVISASQSLPFVVAAIMLIAIVTVIMLVKLNNAVIPAVFASVTCVGVIVLILNGAVATVIRPILAFISPQYSFYETVYGTVTVSAFVQPILFTAVFLVFTALNHANYNKELGKGDK